MQIIIVILKIVWKHNLTEFLWTEKKLRKNLDWIYNMDIIWK